MSDLNKFFEQLAVIKQAPLLHAVAFAAACLAIWLIVNWAYSNVLSGKNATTEYQDKQLADFREKSKSATPEEIGKKLQTLETLVSE